MYTLSEINSFRAPNADTYIYDIIPVSSGIASISSDDVLRLLDPLVVNGQPITSIRNFNKDVTCLERCGDGDVVCTGGRDGRVLLTDLRSGNRIGEVRSGEFDWIC